MLYCSHLYKKYSSCLSYHAQTKWVHSFFYGLLVLCTGWCHGDGDIYHFSLPHETKFLHGSCLSMPMVCPASGSEPLPSTLSELHRRGRNKQFWKETVLNQCSVNCKALCDSKVWSLFAQQCYCSESHISWNSRNQRKGDKKPPAVTNSRTWLGGRQKGGVERRAGDRKVPLHTTFWY